MWYLFYSVRFHLAYLDSSSHNSNSIQVANGKTSFFFIAEKYSILCVCICISTIISVIYLCLRVYLCILHQWTLGSFHILAIVNNPTFNIGMWTSFQNSAFIFFDWIHRGRIAESCSSLFIYLFFEKPPDCFL